MYFIFNCVLQLLHGFAVSWETFTTFCLLGCILFFTHSYWAAFDCEWQFFLFCRSLQDPSESVLVEKHQCCTDVYQTGREMKVSLEKKKNEVILEYVRDHHGPLFTPLTKRNSYLNVFGFTENLWERNWVNVTTGMAGVHERGEVSGAVFCCSLRD